jgi:hypothetical protein
MFADSSIPHASEEMHNMKSRDPSHAACEMQSTRDGKKRFYSFEFSQDERRQMQNLLHAYLSKQEDPPMLHQKKDFRVTQAASAQSMRKRGAQRTSFEDVDFSYQQPSLTDSELSDDEFSDDEFCEDIVD